MTEPPQPGPPPGYAAGTPAPSYAVPPPGSAYAPPPGTAYPAPPGPAYAPPPQLASPWTRLGAALLNGVLMVVTLGVGYLVWAMVLWNEGTNPAKKMLGLRIVSAETGQTLTWGGMFVRNFVFGGLVLGPLNIVTLNIVGLVDALMVFGDRHQRLIDKMSHTLVVTR